MRIVGNRPWGRTVQYLVQHRVAGEADFPDTVTAGTEWMDASKVPKEVLAAYHEEARRQLAGEEAGVEDWDEWDDSADGAEAGGAGGKAGVPPRKRRGLMGSQGGV